MKRLGMFSMLGAVFVVAGCGEGVMEPVATEDLHATAPSAPLLHVAGEDGGATVHSDDAELIPDITAPSAGEVLQASTATFNWTHGGTGDRDAYRYKIECTGAGCTTVAPTTLAGSATTVDEDLAPGSYTFFLRGEKTSGGNLHAPMWVTVDFVVVDASTTWYFAGFYRPVSQDPDVMTRIRRGATAPLKFNVFEDEDLTEEITDVEELEAGFTMTPISCNGIAEELDEDFETTGGTSLRYDDDAGQFVQNWQAPRRTGCYEVELSTLGGSLFAKFDVF
jgi:hypothetical protein